MNGLVAALACLAVLVAFSLLSMHLSGGISLAELDADVRKLTRIVKCGIGLHDQLSVRYTVSDGRGENTRHCLCADCGRIIREPLWPKVKCAAGFHQPGPVFDREERVNGETRRYWPCTRPGGCRGEYWLPAEH